MCVIINREVKGEGEEEGEGEGSCSNDWGDAPGDYSFGILKP